MSQSVYRVSVGAVRHVHAHSMEEAEQKMVEYIRRQAGELFYQTEQVVSGDEFIDEEVE